MASRRQVRNWVVDCLRQHLAPDALAVQPCIGDQYLVVYPRKPGTEDEPGQPFTIEIHGPPGRP